MCKCGKTHRVDEKHIHWIGDSRATGVTTISSFCGNKDGLHQWYANMTAKELKEKYGSMEGTEFFDNFLKILEEARYAAKREKEEAAERGTATHKIIEIFVKRAIKNDGFIWKQVSDIDLTADNQQARNFVDWAVENKVKFLASEMLVHHGEYIGGILDFLCEIDGKKYIGDIKCRKAIYGTEFIQLGGYKYLLEEEHGIKVDGAVIVRLGENDTEVKYCYEMDIWVQGFLGAFTAYKAYNSYKPNNGK